MFDIYTNTLGFFDDYLIQFFSTQDMTDSQRKEAIAVVKNNRAFKLQFFENMNIFLNSFSIKSKSGQLPPGVNERTLKLSFAMYGCVVLRNKVMQSGKEYPGFYAQPGYGMGIYNMNRDPLRAFIQDLSGANGQEIELYLPGEEAEGATIGMDGSTNRNPSGFIVWHNQMRIPPILYISYYSMKQADVFRSLDTQIPWLGAPVIFTAPKKLVNSINEAVRKIFNHESYTVQSESIGGVSQATNLVNTNVNGQTLKDSTGLYQWYEAQLLQYLGINTNSNFDKKGENLIEAELTSNDEITEINKNGPIDCMNYYFEMGAKMPGFEECDLYVEPTTAGVRGDGITERGDSDADDNSDDNAERDV